jgi:hypothetical protein
MGVFKSVFTRAIEVIPSANCLIPNPALLTVSDLTTGVATDQLACNNVNFIQLNVQVGDIVYNYTDVLAATVVQVIDANTLLLNADIFAGVGTAFNIYAGTQNSGSLAGCVLCNPSGVSRVSLTNVETIGGDIIDEIAIPSAQNILLIQVKAVEAADAPVFALW